MQFVFLIGQIPAGQIECSGTRIVDLNPVGMVLEELVVQARLVVCHEFGDQRRSSQQRPVFERLHDRSPPPSTRSVSDAVGK